MKTKRLLAVLGAAVIAVATLGTPATAAVPDRLGYVTWSGAAVVASGTTPAATTVVPLGVGRYRVTFPGQGVINGIVHVTAISGTPHFCQPEAWGVSGVDEVVIVRCSKPGGALDNSGFTALFTRSSGPGASGPYGYVDANAAGALISQYNSAGAVNTVTPLAVGQWLVRFPGLATPGPIDGSLQATAVNSAAAARCKVVKWASGAGGQEATIWCLNAVGGFLNTRFTVSYQHRTTLFGRAYGPNNFGYFWHRPPVGPPPTNFNSILGPGANTLTPAGVGLSLVKFPRIGLLPDHILVTAAGPNTHFCGLNTVWGHAGPDILVRDVNCFTAVGAPVDTGFLVSANSIV
ncbi:MAG: hypothetical protein HOV79_31640 [Hamadaea sp.]|nr:hypothetical protein [Hamadaea sp.]